MSNLDHQNITQVVARGEILKAVQEVGRDFDDAFRDLLRKFKEAKTKPAVSSFLQTVVLVHDTVTSRLSCLLCDTVCEDSDPEKRESFRDKYLVTVRACGLTEGQNASLSSSVRHFVQGHVVSTYPRELGLVDAFKRIAHCLGVSCSECAIGKVNSIVKGVRVDKCDEEKVGSQHTFIDNSVTAGLKMAPHNNFLIELFDLQRACLDAIHHLRTDDKSNKAVLEDAFQTLRGYLRFDSEHVSGPDDSVFFTTLVSLLADGDKFDQFSGDGIDKKFAYAKSIRAILAATGFDLNVGIHERIYYEYMNYDYDEESLCMFHQSLSCGFNLEWLYSERAFRDVKERAQKADVGMSMLWYKQFRAFYMDFIRNTLPCRTYENESHCAFEYFLYVLHMDFLFSVYYVYTLSLPANAEALNEKYALGSTHGCVPGCAFEVSVDIFEDDCEVAREQGTVLGGAPKNFTDFFPVLTQAQRELYFEGVLEFLASVRRRADDERSEF